MREGEKNSYSLVKITIRMMRETFRTRETKNPSKTPHGGRGQGLHLTGGRRGDTRGSSSPASSLASELSSAAEHSCRCAKETQQLCDHCKRFMISDDSRP